MSESEKAARSNKLVLVLDFPSSVALHEAFEEIKLNHPNIKMSFVEREALEKARQIVESRGREACFKRIRVTDDSITVIREE